MITDRDVFSTGLFVLSLLLLVPFYQSYRKIKTEKFRHKLYLLRNNLLCEVRDLGVSFEDRNYVELRNVINCFIVFGNKLNAWILFSMLLEIKKRGLIEERKRGLGSDVQEKYQKLLDKTNSELGNSTLR